MALFTRDAHLFLPVCVVAASTVPSFFISSFLFVVLRRTYFFSLFFHYRFSRCSSSRARPCTIDRAYGFAALVIVPPNCRNVRCADVNANDICSA